MNNLSLGSMPSLRRQHLLAEFSGLKQACPDGIFLSLTPGDPTLWSGVMFIRKGPYENAILRFQISFPDSYPVLPPLVTFSTDLFHPLIAPLTTYMYTTDIQDSGTVSATDDERLPPGGYSLRHGFPGWFGRRSRVSGNAQQRALATPAKGGISSVNSTPNSKGTGTSETPGTSNPSSQANASVSAYEVLHYIRSTFDDEAVLDALPLEASGNPGAWHAWRTRQRQLGKASASSDVEVKPQDSVEEGDKKGVSEEEKSAEESKENVVASAGTPSTPTAPTRRPGDWNWEGVWDTRVKKGIAASLSEPVLYGGVAAGDDLVSTTFRAFTVVESLNGGGTESANVSQIHFLAMDEGDVETAKDNLLRTLGSAV